MTEVSRRTLLVGAAATAASAAFGTVAVPLAALAQTVPSDDLKNFVALSAKLTGIAASRLTPSVDPIGVASDYLSEARTAANFGSMLKAFEESPTDETVANLLKEPRTMYLCRSIILAWYLGAWYEPDTLEAEANRSAKAVANKPSAKRYNLVKCHIISPATYTQGWVWRLAQAHPMGYGNLQFGYWSEQPPKLEDFIS